MQQNNDWNIAPDEIERQSFAIIDHEAGAHGWEPAAWTIVRRMIHTSGDFSWIDSVRMHPQAIAAGIAALRAGRPIYTDTRMAQAGIGKTLLTRWGVEVICLVDDPAVAAQAKEQGVTRSLAGIDLSLERMRGGIYVIGNAPTALFRLLEQAASGRARPALVIGLPVGFVNAAESKQALADQEQIPYITALGRKGGSNLAAAVVNALARLAREGERS
ncbi:MAG: precorrin-8X methylmutase [Desulfarculus sp.]|nr:precorrin-8X methylmutase [Desulfarculus sp.]